MTPQPLPFSDGMVEAAARVLWSVMAPRGRDFDHLFPVIRASVDNNTRAVLAAAVDECEVIEEWCVAGEYLGQDGERHSWPVRWQRTRPDTPGWLYVQRIMHRLVVTTAAQEETIGGVS